MIKRFLHSLFFDCLTLFFINQFFSKKALNISERGICISRSPTLCLAPGPGPNPGPRSGPQFVFTGPGTQFVFTDLGPQFVFNGPVPQFIFTGPGPKFLFIRPCQSGAWACIYQPCPPNLYLLALACDFYDHALNLHLPSYL